MKPKQEEIYACMYWTIEDVRNMQGNEDSPFKNLTDKECHAVLKEADESMCEAMTQAGWVVFEDIARYMGFGE